MYRQLSKCQKDGSEDENMLELLNASLPVKNRKCSEKCQLKFAFFICLFHRIRLKRPSYFGTHRMLYIMQTINSKRTRALKKSLISIFIDLSDVECHFAMKRMLSVATVPV